MYRYKKALCVCLAFALLWSMATFSASATEQATVYPCAFPFEEFWYDNALPSATFATKLPSRSCLLMEASTGKVLYSEHGDDPLPIASVTKVMAMLLIFEDLELGKICKDDVVTVSEYAASMGGSQIFLECGEQMSVHDLLKSLVVASANDATVALAEAVCGSEEAFIERMNQKASELGLANTHFSNTNGLPAENHHSSAYDVALTTKALLQYPAVLEYTGIWTDTVRGGSFGLANTNKLIRYYEGANGMKTGYTSDALYCLSATAKRGEMQLIAVVLGAPTSDDRFALAKQLLDFGFANFTLYTPEVVLPERIPVVYGDEDTVTLSCTAKPLLLEKGKEKLLKQSLSLPECIDAPVERGQTVGSVTFSSEQTPIGTVPVYATGSVGKLTRKSIFRRILTNIFRVL